jgi:hypothetical protein
MFPDHSNFNIPTHDFSSSGSKPVQQPQATNRVPAVHTCRNPNCTIVGRGGLLLFTHSTLTEPYGRICIVHATRRGQS